MNDHLSSHDQWPFCFSGLPVVVPIINVVLKKIMFNSPDLSGHKIKTMKALKIFALTIISSMFLWACEDNAVDPGPSFTPAEEVTEAPEWHSSQAAYN